MNERKLRSVVQPPWTCVLCSPPRVCATFNELTQHRHTRRPGWVARWAWVAPGVLALALAVAGGRGAGFGFALGWWSHMLWLRWGADA